MGESQQKPFQTREIMETSQSENRGAPQLLWICHKRHEVSPLLHGGYQGPLQVGERRSQKHSYTWEGLMDRLKDLPLFGKFEKRKWKQLGGSFEDPRAGNSHAGFCESFTLCFQQKYEVILLDG